MTQDNAQFDKKLQFFGMDEADYRQFPKIAGWLRRLAPSALDRFYAKIRRTPETARFFKTEQMINHARGKQLDHWLDLFDGRADDAYRGRAEQIGTVHARIGLEPGWYIGGYASLLAQIIPQMTHSKLTRSLGLGQSGTQVATLVKTALLDMDIALSTYFAVEEQKRQAVIDQLGGCLAALAKGDFSRKLTDLPPGYSRIEQDYESMRVSMESTLRTVADGALSISTGAAEIRQASDDLASRTERQAASLEETAAATDHLTDGVKRAADGASEMSHIINQAEHEAQDGGKVVSEAVTAMSVIQKSATEIGSIVDLIDGIAFQTNLLALNAGVEAARAGDAGKGFAVVANEVRALAQRAADAAKGIKTLISTSIDQIERGGSLVAQSGEAFTSIVERVSSISSKAREIADLAQEQSVSLQQVNSAIREMDQMTQSNAAMVEEANAAARSQADEAAQLETLIAQFNLSKSTVTRLVQPRAEHQAVTPAARVRSRKSASVVAHAVKPDNEDWSDF